MTKHTTVFLACVFLLIGCSQKEVGLDRELLRSALVGTWYEEPVPNKLERPEFHRFHEDGSYEVTLDQIQGDVARGTFKVLSGGNVMIEIASPLAATQVWEEIFIDDGVLSGVLVDRPSSRERIVTNRFRLTKEGAKRQPSPKV